MFVLLSVVSLALSKVHWSNINDGSKWVPSSGKDNLGKWDVSNGLRTTEDGHFYDISAEFPEFSNKGKTFVVSFSVKHGQNIDCGGGYVKLLPAGLDQKAFTGDSDYNIMFGPDICGGGTRKVHVILTKDGKNHLINKNIPCETDDLTHLYTLVVRPDNTYAVYIDGVEKQTGSIEDDWSILPPKKIKDPSKSKPADWVDDPKMDDPEDVKPAGWDAIPAEIVDPEAEKPDDWDDDLDGEWEAPKIPNPDYKGPWSPARIDNPAYKGPWVHPEIDNPDFKNDPTLYQFDSFKFIGIDVWQVKSGSTFDHFVIADSFDDIADSITKVQEIQKVERADKAAKEAAAKAAEAENDDHEDL